MQTVINSDIIKKNENGGEPVGSLAFWYTKKARYTGDPLSVVMNFNLWTQCASSEETFLDIGFVVSNIASAEHLTLYIPFKKADVKDLTDNIRDSKTMSAIFNESYSIVDLSNTVHFWPVRNSTGDTVFYIYSWEKSPETSAVSIQPINASTEHEGTIFKINTSAILAQFSALDGVDTTKKNDLYFRFRVTIPNTVARDTIVRKYTPRDSFLQSTLATTYIVDFRFDDLRSLPSSITESMQTQKFEFTPVSKLHFFLMTKAHVDVETGPQAITIRELEENTWDDYISKRFDTRDIVAYHYKAEKKPICQWELFAKVKVNHSTWMVIVGYLLVLALISGTINFISNVIWSLFISLPLWRTINEFFLSNIGICVIIFVLGVFLGVIIQSLRFRIRQSRDKLTNQSR